MSYSSRKGVPRKYASSSSADVPLKSSRRTAFQCLGIGFQLSAQYRENLDRRMNLPTNVLPDVLNELW